jgi:hypothetical protein
MSLSRGAIPVYMVLLIAITALLIPIARIETNILQHTRETITYPHDNAFLNMTVAQNLAFHNVWGISKYSYQSASSSPLYTILLAVIYFIVGANLAIPLIINLLAAIFLLIVVQRWLMRRDMPATGQLLILLLLIFLTPLPPIIISGTEQTMQLLLSFLFIRTFLEATAATRPAINPNSSLPTTTATGSPLPRWVFLYAAGMVLTGYECSLIAVAAIGFLCERRQWKEAAKLAAAAFLPLLLFGILSIIKGGYFLPNPLLDSSAILSRSTALVIGNAIIFIGGHRKIIRARAAMIVILLLLAVPLYLRSANAFTVTGRECIALYGRQFHVARFVHHYYNKWSIALDEPGMISWWSEGRKLDLSGMASSNVMRSLRAHDWLPPITDSLSEKENVAIAIVSGTDATAGLFRRWNKVASWKTLHDNSSGYDNVDFYVHHAWDTAGILKNLKEFQPSLPAETVVRYY